MITKRFREKMRSGGSANGMDNCVITINATFKCLAYRTRNYNDNDADRHGSESKWQERMGRVKPAKPNRFTLMRINMKSCVKINNSTIKT